MDDLIILKFYPLNINKPLKECTMEDLQKAYENGYKAVLNDGKLLGFKHEKKIAL